MSVFEKIKNGLEEAISYERGTLHAKTRTISVDTIENFTPEEIKEIRVNSGLSQKLFAQYMGVSIKTIEAWEAGRNRPIGASCRLLALTKHDPDFPVASGIVHMNLQHM